MKAGRSRVYFFLVSNLCLESFWRVCLGRYGVDGLEYLGDIY